MVFQGYKMLWGRGAQRKTITCLQTCTHPSLRGRPAMWITSVVFQGRRNLRMYDLPASSDQSTERWSQSNAASVLRWDCALTAEHCNRGAAGIPALTRADPGSRLQRHSLPARSLIRASLQGSHRASPWENDLQAALTCELQQEGLTTTAGHTGVIQFRLCEN